MDQELKQRLIGAAVVTALAAIFIPMLFDDPIDDSGQVVSELAIPQPPVTAVQDTAHKLPSGPDQVFDPQIGESPAPADGQNASQEPQPYTPGNGEQQASIDTETGLPVDEQQWIEERRAEEVESLEETSNISKTPSNQTDYAKSKVTAKAENIIKKPVSKSLSADNKPLESVQKTSVAPSAPAKAVTVSPAIAKKPPVQQKVESAKLNTGLSRLFIQAGSFSKKENALSRLENLRKQGLPVLMETQSTDKGPIYRLKVGPELDKKRAIEIRDRLNKQNIKTIIVLE